MQASLLRALFMVVMLYVPDRYAMRLRFEKPCALTVAQVLEHSGSLTMSRARSTCITVI